MKVLIQVILIIITSLSFAQSVKITLTVEPSTLSAGEEVTISVSSNTSGRVYIENLNNIFQEYGSFESVNQTFNGSKGRWVTNYTLSKTGSFLKEGTFTVGPALIEVNGKRYYSNRVKVTVKKGSNNNDSFDTNTGGKAQIFTSKDTCYLGEPVFVAAEIYSVPLPVNIERYESYSFDGFMESHELAHPGVIDLKKKRVNNRRYYYFSIDKKNILPGRVGHMNILPFKITLSTEKGLLPMIAEKKSIYVLPLPLPEPLSFCGAVGTFSLKSRIHQETIHQNEVLYLTVKIKGKGNLSWISPVKLSLPKGISLYEEAKIEKAFIVEEDGQQGEVRIKYPLQVSKTGRLRLPPFPFVYFNLQTEQYDTLFTKEFHFDVIPSDDSKVEKYTFSKNDQSSDFPVVLFVSGVILLLIAGIFVYLKQRRGNNKDN